ncbi:MAG: MmgE/PrpD family protein [bacterium]|nr:MmgE/PrpD family protein [Betaproteobacteria bacterium]
MDATPAPPDVTGTLARFVADSEWRSIPPGIRHEARRALLNWLGCALGGCRDEAVCTALDAMRDFAGPSQATLLGRGERIDAMNAALLNGIASNILDFDDTHLRTVIHPTVPVASALLALAEHRGASGADFLHALVLGIEVECRIGNAVSPAQFDEGWHVTSTCGVFGAAAACGRLLGLDAQRLAWALGLAATQASGITAVHGSMGKSFNMGHAARDGLAAALLAARGFTGGEHCIEAARGFARLFVRRPDLDAPLDRLGTAWELSQVAYKPYPCGIVAHPVIDACIELRAALLQATSNAAGNAAFDAGPVARIELKVHPLVITMMSNAQPATGLQAKLSTAHVAAVALLHGRVGVDAFTDDCVSDPGVTALRGRVALQADAGIAKEAVEATLQMADGTHHHRRVAVATGSLERPLDDRALEEKFRVLAQGVLPAPGAVDALAALAWSIDDAPDVGRLARMSSPTGE